MEIRLDGHQLVTAAQAYIKKEYGADLSTARCSEAWVHIDHYRTEYKRNKNGTLKRKQGHLVVDEEKAERIQQTFPAEDSASLELYFEILSPEEPGEEA
jgi:hypothetical protein